MKYSSIIKSIVGGAFAVGGMVAANIFAKEQKVDHDHEDIKDIKSRLNGIGVQSSETIDINFSDGFAASDQDVDNAIWYYIPGTSVPGIIFLLKNVFINKIYERNE